MRKSIVAAIEREADLTVCGEAEDAPAALAAIVALQPDLLVTDLQLKSSNGIDLIASLRARAITLPIVATTLFSVHDSERVARAAGASAFVPKNHGPEQLIVAARALLGPDGAAGVRRESSPGPDEAEQPHQLSRPP